MKRPILIILILSLILAVSGVVYVLAEKYGPLVDSTFFNSSPEKTQTTSSPAQEEQTDSTQASSIDGSPPLPTQYWSELAEQLMRVEEERIDITEILLQTFPPPDMQSFTSPNSIEQETETVSAPQPEKTETQQYFTLSSSKPETQIYWTNISQQVLQLEQKRQQIIDGLTR